MKVYVLMIYHDILDQVEVFSSEEALAKAFKKYTGFSYRQYVDGQLMDEENWNNQACVFETELQN